MDDPAKASAPLGTGAIARRLLLLLPLRLLRLRLLVLLLDRRLIVYYLFYFFPRNVELIVSNLDFITSFFHIKCHHDRDSRHLFYAHHVT